MSSTGRAGGGGGGGGGGEKRGECRVANVVRGDSILTVTPAGEGDK